MTLCINFNAFCNFLIYLEMLQRFALAISFIQIPPTLNKFSTLYIFRLYLKVLFIALVLLFCIFLCPLSLSDGRISRDENRCYSFWKQVHSFMFPHHKSIQEWEELSQKPISSFKCKFEIMSPGHNISQISQQGMCQPMLFDVKCSKVGAVHLEGRFFADIYLSAVYIDCLVFRRK